MGKIEWLMLWTLVGSITGGCIVLYLLRKKLEPNMALYPAYGSVIGAVIVFAIAFNNLF